MSAQWDYSGLYGEHKWDQHFRTGLRQSPINILTRDVVRKEEFSKKPLNFNGVATSFSIVNKGNNVSFKPLLKVNSAQSCVSGGPLENSMYCFEECHMHWGRNNNKGCEHEIDGKRYDAELHLVHRFKECTFSDALNRANGLSVLGIFLEAEEDATTPPFINNLITCTKKVHYKGDTIADSEQQFEPYKMLESICKEFYTYEGSLTTPPLSECVRWVVFKNPIKVSTEDYTILQNIIAVENKSNVKMYHDPFTRNEDCTVTSMPTIGDNYRSCCRSDGRKIESSF